MTRLGTPGIAVKKKHFMILAMLTCACRSPLE